MGFKSKEMKHLWRKLEKVYFNIDPTIEKTVQNNENFIIKMNTEQMYKGELSTGKEIRPSYAPATIAYKKRKGQPFDRVTLRDTGQFYKKLKVIARYKDFVIDTSLSGARPYGFLMKGKRSYGEDILGLNDKNKKELVNKKLLKPLEKLFNTLKK